MNKNYTPSKLLTQKDIEELGWKLSEVLAEGQILIFSFPGLKPHYLEFRVDYGACQITRGNIEQTPIFDGHLENYNELKTLMRQLNIK